MQLNLQLLHVVTDMSGGAGIKNIRRAILAGGRQPEVLASFRDCRCKASQKTIRQALIGHYRPKYLFTLQQAMPLYYCPQGQVVLCDQHIERTLQ
ncbi:hypothetical protein QU481_22435 [Crenobacter sp. SG2303]|uniref:Uncharacterized protein n=1 Tax=Crenobacter oryzisoli TaxID=3056844 RepID=A0ABT7XUV3_9NEIS|nr:hypothetical protein [Crenobacter sp. SG2303]MDN0077583.1 hypothetical protein [Crenobacter sp. SG2303]